MKPVSTDLIHAELIRASIDDVIRLRAENARLREALKPFANKAKLLDSGALDDGCVVPFSFEMGQLRAARAAMGESDGN